MMKRTRQWFLLVPVAIAGLLMLWAARSGAQGSQQGSSAPAASQRSAPANPQTVPPFYNSEKEAKPFPRLLSPDTFRGYPAVVRAYQIASAIPGMIAQQPCYCWCSNSVGHKSLLDCYSYDHGAS